MSGYPCRYGVNVPGIRMVDAQAGVLGLEWIDGKSVRLLLGGGAENEEEAADDEDLISEESIREDPLGEFGISQGIFFRSPANWSANTVVRRHNAHDRRRDC